MFIQVYHTYLFFKGPILYSTSGIIEKFYAVKILSSKSFRTKLRNAILACQNEGDRTEWQTDNFVFSKYKGFQSSAPRHETFKKFLFDFENLGSLKINKNRQKLKSKIFKIK